MALAHRASADLCHGEIGGVIDANSWIRTASEGEMSDYDVESEINNACKQIIEKGHKLDDHAFGKLAFLLALRRVLTGKGTPEDLGLMDAVNDFLQARGIVACNATFRTL